MTTISPYTRKAQFYETDQMGIIHHANYIRWFEEARIDYMEKLGFGYEQATTAGIDFAVLGVSCEYKSMVRFGDTVDIHITITYLSPIKIILAYQIFDKAAGELRATGETCHCSYHSQKKRPVSLKKELPQLYTLFLEQTEEAKGNAID